MKFLLLLGLAGFAGTLCRYGLTRLPWPESFPFGTLVINVIGAFIAGFCAIWLQAKYPEYASYFPIFFIGFLGAFTTFSTFALESSRILLDGHLTKFLADVALQNILGIAGAVVGILSARFFTA